MYKNFLFDLDGTLLPMNMEHFVNIYLSTFCKRFSPVFGISAELIADAFYKGLAAMIKNNGSKLNKDVFYDTASEIIGLDMRDYSEELDDYYLSEFTEAKKAAEYTPASKRCIDFLKVNKPVNGKLIAATNPIFPEIATLRRLAWAGVSGNDFDYITVFENSSYCKPNLNYYKSVCEKCSIKPQESIMIGNDVEEDMCAAELGFDTYLITDCVINRNNKDYSGLKHGTFEEFYNFLVNICRE